MKEAWSKLRSWLEHSPAPPPPAAETGASGERWAAEFLRRERGFKLVAQNWKNPRDRREEIDLVCRDGEVLVFVEVKTRPLSALVPGYHAVDRRKKAVLRRACAAYLRALRPPDRPRAFRFDIVEVGLRPDGSRQVLHFENIALFSKQFLP